MNTLLVISLTLLTVVVLTLLTKKSIETLGTKIEPFYKFGLSLKKPGIWAVVFYLLIISILVIISFFSAKIDFSLIRA